MCSQLSEPTSRQSGLAGVGPAFRALLIALLVIGFGARLAPFFDVDNRLLEQFVTEDGYFMLAIARNLAIGNGFSIADGEMPTNGTQPLTTLLFTVGFALVGGAKKAGVGIAQAIQFAASIAAAGLLYRLGLKVFARRQDGARIAALAAATWFASPIAITHSMNGLETGVYALVAVAVAFRFVPREEDDHRIWTVGGSMATGVLLGVAFWARNDAAFLILAACLTYVYCGLPYGFDAMKARFGRALIFGTTSVLVATPWLAFNYSLFQHIVPVSGRAESLTAEPFQNVLEVPPVLLEYIGVFLPIPQVYEGIPAVAAACILPVLAVLAIVAAQWGRAHRTEQVLIVLVLIYGTCLSAFYGFYFGAGWFMARYLFPISPFLALLWAFWVFVWLRPRARGFVQPVLAVAMVVLIIGQQARWYILGDRHPHFQVIEWAQANIPDPMWVAAIQTGTLGYFHNRTYNLDGKVNIDAYFAAKNLRRGPYVVSTDAEYLLDWTGMAHWLTKPPVQAQFRLLVFDERKRLAVLQRRDRIRLGADLTPDRDAVLIGLRQAKSALDSLPDEPEHKVTRWTLLYQIAWLDDLLERERSAEAYAEEALGLADEAMVRPRATAKAERWLARQIQSRRQLAAISRSQLRLDDALSHVRAAVDLMAKASNATTAAARRELALTRLDEGEIHWEVKDLDAAKTCFSEALEIQETLLQAGFSEADRDRAVSLLALGDVAVENGLLDEAEALFEQTWQIRKRRHEEATDDRQATFDLALAEARLGRLAHLKGQTDAARDRINASIALRRSLPKLNPAAAEPAPARAIQFNEGLMGFSSFDSVAEWSR